MNTPTRLVLFSLSLTGTLLAGCSSADPPAVAGRGGADFDFGSLACNFTATFQSLVSDPTTVVSCVSCAAHVAASTYADGSPQAGLEADAENCESCGVSYAQALADSRDACVQKLRIQNACSNACPAGTHAQFDSGAVTYDGCTAYNCPCVDDEGCVRSPQNGAKNACTAAVGPSPLCPDGSAQVPVSRNGGGFDCVCPTRLREPASCNPPPPAADPGPSDPLGPPAP